MAIVWNGDEWVTDSAMTLETEVKPNPNFGVVRNRAFDLAYESISNNLVVAWGKWGWGDFNYAVRRSGTGQWFPENQHVDGVISGDSHFVDLSPDPESDHIAGGFYDLGDGQERLGLAMWNGEDWQDTGEPDNQIRDVNDDATGDLAGGVGWIASEGIAVAIYPDNQQGTLDWARWDQSGGWSVRSDIVIANKGYTESVQLEMTPDGNRLLVLLTDHNLRLYGATYDGNGWQLSNLGGPITTSISSITTVPFSLAVRSK